MSALSLLCACSINELLEGLSLKSFSPEHIVSSCLQRISARDSDVKGWAYLDTKGAITSARERCASESPGKLHGIPFAVKDVFEVESTPKSFGSSLYSADISTKSSSVVEKLLDMGGICLGKTITAEFALYKPGKTRNPHDRRHTPGGSSSGSAATVADYQVPLALGTQTAGSIVRPASYCGVVGYKPSFGRYSRAGVLQTSPTLDTVGFFVRTADDALLVDEILAEGAQDEQTHSKFKVGIFQHQAMAEASSIVRAAMEMVGHRFSVETFDLKKIDPNPQFLDLNEIHQTIHAFEARKCLLSLDGFQISRVSSATRAFLDSAASIPESKYDLAIGQLMDLRKRCLDLFEDCDALITPAAPDYAPRGLKGTGDPVFNRMWTALGVPCVAFPVIGFPEALPLGLQLIGRPNEDQKLLGALRRIAR